jgi:hypothetical protein
LGFKLFDLEFDYWNFPDGIKSFGFITSFMPFKTFQSLASSRVRFGFFMFLKLPSAFFSGVRLRRIDEHHAIVSVPYKWFSQNPFKSTYFACQAMAAEMSTGVLALGHIYQRRPGVSMLVTALQANYFKKAAERVYFTCDMGIEMRDAIEKAIATGQGQTIEAISIGRTASGELISQFHITWSFKAKGNQSN